MEPPLSPLAEGASRHAARAVAAEGEAGLTPLAPEPPLDPAELVRYSRPTGSPPPEPTAYDATYLLPVHREKSLQARHPHPRDARICFYETPHVYTVDGRFVGVSASSLLHGFVEEFDVDRTLAGMQTGRTQAWPRLRYAVGARPATRASLDAARAAGEDPLVLAVAAPDGANDGKTTYAGPWSAWPAEGAEGAGGRGGRGAGGGRGRGRGRGGGGEDAEGAGGAELFTYERAMTDAEVRVKWSDPEPCNRGTEAHAMMELWCNGEPARVDAGEGAVGLRFIRDQLARRGIRAFRTEWEIFAEEEDVAGSVDFAGVWPDGRIVLVDWKRTPKLEEHLRTHFRKKMESPLGHLEDCDGAKYAMQLSIYCWIIKKYMGVRVHGLALCSLHPDAPFHTWVPYLRLEVDYLTRKRRELVAARLTLEAGRPDLPRCARTGRIAFDAVRDAGGGLCDEKLARIADEAAEPCAEARAECARALGDVRARASREEARLAQGAVAWARQMPAAGIQQPPAA